MPSHWFKFQTMCFKFAHDNNKKQKERNKMPPNSSGDF